MGHFWFTSKSIFLIYLHYILKLKTCFKAIKVFKNLRFSKFYTIWELYKDSTLYYYILGKFENKPNIKNLRKFDI